MAKSGRNVIGSTGTNAPALSDEAIQYKLSAARTVRYQYHKLSDNKTWCCWVCGPFHSRMYGVSSFGTSKFRAKTALRTNLANNYGYIGHLLFSDVDTADTIGKVNKRLLNVEVVLGNDAKSVPITRVEAAGGFREYANEVIGGPIL